MTVLQQTHNLFGTARKTGPDVTLRKLRKTARGTDDITTTTTRQNSERARSTPPRVSRGHALPPYKWVALSRSMDDQHHPTVLPVAIPLHHLQEEILHQGVVAVWCSSSVIPPFQLLVSKLRARIPLALIYVRTHQTPTSSTTSQGAIHPCSHHTPPIDPVIVLATEIKDNRASSQKTLLLRHSTQQVFYFTARCAPWSSPRSEQAARQGPPDPRWAAPPC